MIVNKKRVVFIGGSLASGGAEHQCTQLMNMLVEKGYDVTYASFGDTPDHYVVSDQVNRVWLGKGKSARRKIWEVEKYLLFVKADIVFAFSQRLSCLTLLPMIFRPRIKVISSERNFTIGKPDVYEKVLTKTGLYRRANYIVPNNFSQGRYLSLKMPSVASKVCVITNYTDISRYVATPLPNNDIVRIGVFCRFEKQKNFHKFLESLYVLNERTDYRYKYHIDWYGNHSFPTEEQTKYFDDGLQKIEDYRLTEYITIHNPTHEVHKLIPTFDVMCLPSLHEGFSNSISEYICCGRPVICSDVSDNSVMVHNGENGFLFDPLNEESIMNAFIQYFETAKVDRIKMGQKSREIAKTLFNKEVFLNKYIALIEA